MIYSIALYLYALAVVLVSPFRKKAWLMVKGQWNTFRILRKNIRREEMYVWFHAASLGEFEQGRPLMERLRREHPEYKILLTFFSPSGYEVRKNNTMADVTVYLPLDTKKNAQHFLKLVHPDLVFFIKYEYWPNYLYQLKKEGIKTYLISGILRKNQLFFKWYGGFFREALDTFTYFFVQNDSSKKLLLQLGKTNVAVSGDTRFDRVAAILEKDNSLDFIEDFLSVRAQSRTTTTIVIGSSWPKDENILVDFINLNTFNIKFIIAPHNIKSEQILNLKNSITKKTVLFSEKEGKSLADFDVFIIDTIGILTKIYSYADIAYVGGGFGNPGVHNILEPATFGVPIVIGSNYSHFAEATALVNMDGCISVSNQKELNEAFENLIQNEDIQHEKGHICSTFVQMNKGATTIILKHILNDSI